MNTIVIVDRLLLSSKSCLSNARGALRILLSPQLENKVPDTLIVSCSRLLLQFKNTLHKAGVHVWDCTRGSESPLSRQVEVALEPCVLGHLCIRAKSGQTDHEH